MERVGISFHQAIALISNLKGLTFIVEGGELTGSYNGKVDFFQFSISQEGEGACFVKYEHVEGFGSRCDYCSFDMFLLLVRHLNDPSKRFPTRYPFMDLKEAKIRPEYFAEDIKQPSLTRFIQMRGINPLENIELLGNINTARILLLPSCENFTEVQLADIDLMKTAALKITLSALSKIDGQSEIKKHRYFETLIQQITRGFLMNEDISAAFRAVFVQVLQNIILREFPLRDVGVKSFLDSSDSDEEATAPSLALASPIPDPIWKMRRFLKFILLMSSNEFWADAMVNHLYIPGSCYIDDNNVSGFYDQCERIVSGNTQISRFRQNCTRSVLDMISEMKAIYESGPIQSARGNEVDHRIQSIQIIEDCTKIMQNLSIAMNRKHRKELLTFLEAGKIAVRESSKVELKKNGPIDLLMKVTAVSNQKKYWLFHISSFLSKKE
jgi:hypothetical protein